ncbi:hypothetical protein AB0M35_18015 [Micromonospora sp. NPDC051196]|uniref:hypothetical protein n=1 Tax=Micromonospora sp. NPDC051196 TaxID=3155281 RepID=UPI00343C2281
MNRRLFIALVAVVAALWAAAGIAWTAAPATTAGAAVFVVPSAPTYAPPAVEVADGLAVDQAEVAREVHRIVNDPRGWRTDLDHLTVRIVHPGTWRTQPMPGLIGYAHGGHRLAVVTDEAWTTLGPRLAAAGGTLDDQRTWIVLHEIGHLLGHEHVEDCPAGSGPAPIMRPVVYKIDGCDLNVWPTPQA